ncbi:hypothetical protein RHRU231_860071 [Rhodococcus ruber]|uniref:Uncharacterized protein n=1 Tax=Rhodococcus ruber TaxID=1830 RepID=A0A098BTZ6_9NOCA|nr:hypothetical protein RHRU231_860071 [Rhodococcus ruber]
MSPTGSSQPVRRTQLCQGLCHRGARRRAGSGSVGIENGGAGRGPDDRVAQRASGTGAGIPGEEGSGERAAVAVQFDGHAGLQEPSGVVGCRVPEGAVLVDGEVGRRQSGQVDPVRGPGLLGGLPAAEVVPPVPGGVEVVPSGGTVAHGAGPVVESGFEQGLQRDVRAVLVPCPQGDGRGEGAACGVAEDDDAVRIHVQAGRAGGNPLEDRVAVVRRRRRVLGREPVVDGDDDRAGRAGDGGGEGLVGGGAAGARPAAGDLEHDGPRRGVAVRAGVGRVYPHGHLGVAERAGNEPFLDGDTGGVGGREDRVGEGCRVGRYGVDVGRVRHELGHGDTIVEPAARVQIPVPGTGTARRGPDRGHPESRPLAMCVTWISLLPA